MQSIEWFLCSDPAWGNFADLASALAAWVAAVGTVSGVWFAALRYRDSLRDKRRDQARFVHAYITDYRVVEKDGSINARHRAPRLNLPDGVTIRPYVEWVEDHAKNLSYTRALVRVAFCEVTVENRSDEIVRRVYGQLSVWHQIESGGRSTREIGTWDGFPYLLPQSSETFWVAVPYEGPEEDVRDVIDPMIWFVDANGRTWHRSPFGAPEEWGTGESDHEQPALPAPRGEEPELRVWTEDELRDHLVAEAELDPAELVLLSREGRAATFASKDATHWVGFAWKSDVPVVISQHRGEETIKFLRAQAADGERGE